MAGLSVKLPLHSDPDDGIGLNKTYKEVARQNLLNLILTIPGERIMIPDFGVGIKKYLFDNDTPALRAEIIAKIRQQTARYLSYIDILKIEFKSNADNEDVDRNFLGITIRFKVIPLETIDEININRENDDIVFV